MKGVCVQGIFVGSRAVFETMNGALVLHELRLIVDKCFRSENSAKLCATWKRFEFWQDRPETLSESGFPPNSTSKGARSWLR